MSEFLTPQFFGSIAYWQKILRHDSFIYDPTKRFEKSSRMNRTEILTANGVQILSVPVTGGRNIRLTYQAINISYETAWQKQHWHALQSAYGKSAFWEFYRDDLDLFYHTHHSSLIVMNLASLSLMLRWLKLNKKFNPEVQENMHCEIERVLHRQAIPMPSYFQTFSHKFPFESDLSILDLLFNVGPRSTDYLLQLNFNT
jgi:hypothetical protein